MRLSLFNFEVENKFCEIVLRVDINFKSSYSVFLTEAGIVRNNTDCPADEIRWKIIKAMLNDFPQLRQRTKEYLEPEAPDSLRFLHFARAL